MIQKRDSLQKRLTESIFSRKLTSENETIMFAKNSLMGKLNSIKRLQENLEIQKKQLSEKSRYVISLMFETIDQSITTQRRE